MTGAPVVIGFLQTSRRQGERAMKKGIHAAAFVFLGMTVGTGAGFASALAANAPAGTAPEAIRALLSSTDNLLAYQPLNSLGSNGEAAVIVVRHALAGDRSHNPCDLMVLRKERDRFVVVSSSNRAVECVYNSITRRAGELSLDGQLRVTPGKISWSNELSKGHAAYTFAYASDISSWYLQCAEVTFVENARSGDSIDVYKEVASYPGDFARIAMSDFNPASIRKALARHRESVK